MLKNKKTSTCVIDSICDNCAKGNYCTLKEILLMTQHFDDRLLVQLKCMEIFKYEESEREKKDIGWTETGLRWVEQGWAKHFADVYDPEINPRTIFNTIKSKINK